MPLATVRNQEFRFRLHLSRQYLASVLRDPDQVIGNRIVGIPGFPHLQNVLINAIIIADENHTYI